MPHNGPVIYNLFPRLLGPLSAWAEQFPRIAALGFDWVFVNPFHYPGFSGSLYAVKDYYALNPAFDDGSGRSAEEQLKGLALAAERAGLRLMMDLVINHTAKDSPLVQDFPHWYRSDEDGRVQSPFAVDPDNPAKKTVWGDLAALDYEAGPALIEMIPYFRDVALHHARLGIHGFRCDAAYQVPAFVWAAIIEAVREEVPDAVFAAETLGCTPEQVAQLQPAGFDYIFNSVKWWDFKEPWLLEQYEAFRHLAPSIGFPESHDTERLITELSAGTDAEAIYKQRYMVAALFSTGVMMPLGYEFGFGKKPHVVQTTPADWEEPRFDLSDTIGAINRERRFYAVFNEEGPQERLAFEEPWIVALFRQSLDETSYSLTLINTDRSSPHTGWLDAPWVSRMTWLDQAREVTPGRAPEPIRANAALGLGPAEVRVFVRNGT